MIQIGSLHADVESIEGGIHFCGSKGISLRSENQSVGVPNATASFFDDVSSQMSANRSFGAAAGISRN
jgi:hypothetical protein